MGVHRRLRSFKQTASESSLRVSCHHTPHLPVTHTTTLILTYTGPEGTEKEGHQNCYHKVPSSSDPPRELGETPGGERRIREHDLEWATRQVAGLLAPAPAQTDGLCFPPARALHCHVCCGHENCESLVECALTDKYCVITRASEYPGPCRPHPTPPALHECFPALFGFFSCSTSEALRIPTSDPRDNIIL